MTLLTSLAQRIKRLTISSCLLELSKHNDFLDLIIKLNTENQLYQGLNAKGQTLKSIGGDYSAYTKDRKAELGQVYDRITLKDTGEFYNSFKVYLNNSEFVITADTVKDTSDLITDWGRDILGLNEESLVILREKALTIIIPFIKREIL